MAAAGTVDDGAPGYVVTLREYPYGGAELTAVRRDERRLPRSSKPRKSPRPDKKREDHSARRTGVLTRRNIRRLGADRMLTLTKRGKFGTLDEAWGAWGRFRALCRRFYADKFQYVARPEQHADGCWHIHVALRGYRDVGMLRRFWAKALGGTGRETGADTPGNVDMKHFERRGARVVAKYLSKYLTKSLGALPPRSKLIESSRGMLPLHITKRLVPFSTGLGVTYDLKQRVFGSARGVHTVHWQFGACVGFTIDWAGDG